MKAAFGSLPCWLPDAHPSAPAPISAMLSGLIIKCLGIYALLRVFCCVIGVTPALSMVLLFLGALSMGTGAFLAFGQQRFQAPARLLLAQPGGYISSAFRPRDPARDSRRIVHLFTTRREVVALPDRGRR